MDTTSPATLTFVLSGPDRLRWQLSYWWRTQSGRSVAAIFMTVALTGNLVLHPAHDAIAATIVRYGYVLVAPVLIALVLVWRVLTIWRPLNGNERFTVTFADKGIAIGRDGKSEFLSWYGVKSAMACDRFYAIERRADARLPVFIPRSAIADADAFWSYLELRLQGTRPSIRELGVPAPNRLKNRTGQYLIENLTNGTTS